MTKIALVTGASSGFGAATAERFAKEGLSLILTARRVDKLTHLAESLMEKYSINVLSFGMDVTKQEQVKQQLDHLPDDWRAIDILVNNAGLALDLSSVAEGDSHDWEVMMNTNVMGLLYVTKQILPGMIERNSGHIINVSSTSGLQVYPGGAVYCASKHAVNALGDAIRLELLGTDVRHSTVCPGMAETEFSEVRFKGDKDKARQVYQGARALKAEDIADAVYYCVQCPAHVNVNQIVLQPIDQAGVSIHRK